MELCEVAYNAAITINQNREEKKEKGQFFTPFNIASFMSKLSKNRKQRLKIMDPGAGNGVLSIKLCNDLMLDSVVKEIKLIAYETDPLVLDDLQSNYEALKILFEKNDKLLEYEIIPTNYILSNSTKWNSKEYDGFDIIICNPPYKKMSIKAPECEVMKDIVKGQPNVYYLFIAMSLNLLSPNGEMIFITPRSFTSGLYFQSFRNYLIGNGSITDIHSFDNRNDTFQKEKVLQETIVFRVLKNVSNNYEISMTSSDYSFSKSNPTFETRASKVIKRNSHDSIIFIPKSESDANVVSLINVFENNLISLGYKLKTGPVVDFRMEEQITSTDNRVPLFWSSNLKNGKVKLLENSKKPQWISSSNNSYLLDNKDYLIIKRFSSMEEKKRIQCGIYEPVGNYLKIGLENHLNYVSRIDKQPMSKEEVIGFYCLFNSSLYDRYYRLMNGSTQVNANEFNNIPLPDIQVIIDLGRKLAETHSLDSEACDIIVNNFLENGNE